MLYVNNNGRIIPADQPTVDSGNRAFLYGDGLFESIRIISGKPINLQNHMERLFKGAEALKIRIPVFWNLAFFEERILDLLRKSEINHGGRCRVSIDRMVGGTYTPASNEGSYYIDVHSMDDKEFLLNNKGYEIDIYRDLKLQKNFLSPFKTKNGLYKVMSSIAAQENNLDEYLLQNEKGNIIESSSSNIFIVSNGVLYTPGLDEGCIAGTMRMTLINIALQNGIRVYECTILPHNLLSADEIFLTNAIRGIIWVGGYRTKRYLNNTSKRLLQLLNLHWQKELGKNHQV